MTPLTLEQLGLVETWKTSLVASVQEPETFNFLGLLGNFLRECEQQMFALMDGTAPPTTGNIDFALVLYTLQHDLPHDVFFDKLNAALGPSTITTADYTAWKAIWTTDGKVATDGTLYATSSFSQLDNSWTYSFVLYLLGVIGKVPRANLFPVPPPNISPISWPATAPLRIAIIGDWGTGTWDDCGTSGPATEIRQQLQQLDPAPDVLVHLGDVYYSGTGNLPTLLNLFMLTLSVEMEKIAGVPVPFVTNEEKVRLLQNWWTKAPLPASFTLNSNHEMYSGANGLAEALGSPIFAAQKKASHFAIEYGDWAVLGLDSAFFSKSFFNMEGALQNEQRPDQIKWIQGLDLAGKKIVALTHHTALTYDGQCIPGTQLSDDMNQALNGRDPDYWYWGHIHNGIVYKPGTTTSTKRKTTTLCRCVGHAAIPFGTAYTWQQTAGQSEPQQVPLWQNPNIAYCSHTPMPTDTPCRRSQWTNRVLNGFAIVTLTPDGGLTEAFYEQGNPDPVWTNEPTP